MSFFSKNKKDIIINIVAGLLLAVLLSFFSSIGDYLLDLLSKFSEGFSSAYYRRLAMNSSRLYDSFEQFVFTLIILFVFQFYNFYLIDRKKQTQNKVDEALAQQESNIKELEKKLLEVSSTTTPSIKNTDNDNYLEIATEIKDKSILISEQRKLFSTAYRKYDSARYFLIFSTCLMIIVYIIGRTAATNIITENDEFNNKLQILSYYAEDKEIKQLKSRWAVITCKNDLENVKLLVDKRLLYYSEKKDSTDRGESMNMSKDKLNSPR